MNTAIHVGGMAFYWSEDRGEFTIQDTRNGQVVIDIQQIDKVINALTYLRKCVD